LDFSLPLIKILYSFDVKSGIFSAFSFFCSYFFDEFRILESKILLFP
jgi:hypothetical protein